MRIKKEGRQSDPSTRAIEHVNQENGYHNKKKNVAATLSVNKEHKFINAATGREEYCTTAILVKYCSEWKKWLEEQLTACTIQDFWLEKGITTKKIEHFCSVDPIFKARYEDLKEYVGILWSNIKLGKKELKGDINTLRQYGPNYVSEWRKYNREEKEFIEKIKHALEQQDNIQLKKEMAELISKSFIALDRGENESDTKLSDKSGESKTD